MLIPVVSFGTYIFAHAANVPYNDDEALLYSINDIINNPWGIFTFLFEQQNDHRIFFSRFASLAIKVLHGKMDFRIMIIFGYLNLILLGHTFYLIHKSLNTRLIFFIPVVVLLFSPIVYATHLWGITSFEYTLAITFSLYCLFFLQPSKQKIWYWSIPLAIAATLSNLDGLSVLPVALVWLITQKRKKESWYFGIFAALYLNIFFIDFHFSTASHFPPFPQIIGIVFKAFVSFCGSIIKVISDSHVLVLSLFLGAFILLTFLTFNALKFLKKAEWKNVYFPVSMVEICFLELLACGMMIALGRSGDLAESMFAIRFQVYSVSIFILFYLFVLSIFKNQKLKTSFFLIFLFGSLSLSGLSYLKYNNAVVVHNDQLKVDSYNWSNHARFLYQYTENHDPGSRLYENYTFPDYFKEQEINDWDGQLKCLNVSSQITFKSGILNHLPEYLHTIYPVIDFEIGNLPGSVPGEGVYLALFNRNKSDKPFLAAIRPGNAGWYSKIFQNDLIRRSVSVIFPRKMPNDIYDVALCWTSENKLKSILIARNLNLDTINMTMD